MLALWAGHILHYFNSFNNDLATLALLALLLSELKKFSSPFNSPLILRNSSAGPLQRSLIKKSLRSSFHSVSRLRISLHCSACRTSCSSSILLRSLSIFANSLQVVFYYRYSTLSHYFLCFCLRFNILF